MSVTASLPGLSLPTAGLPPLPATATATATATSPAGSGSAALGSDGLGTLPATAVAAPSTARASLPSFPVPAAQQVSPAPRGEQVNLGQHVLDSFDRFGQHMRRFDAIGTAATQPPSTPGTFLAASPLPGPAEAPIQAQASGGTGEAFGTMLAALHTAFSYATEIKLVETVVSTNKSTMRTLLTQNG